MLPIGIDFGTKDAILSSAVLVILGMTVIFHWSVWEFVITEAMIILAFHAGGKKQDKRIEDKYKRMKKGD
ncbi:TPA: hypothetical protein IUV17_002658 [Enterococcus faecalis]|nr:hypothetical protein [Enterococcus faecalis]HAP3937916.1 hypothetical protein [Enterococcus faecalis]HAP4064072.1 hypothetical protein [Enterococcus faecalis]HAP4086363.1 hypothetical protein [Enterococcus faecalis]HAP4129691.1 hypothetical protein [Enterococcus faecalis]